MLGISTWGLMFVPSEISPSIWLCFDFIGGSGVVGFLTHPQYLK